MKRAVKTLYGKNEPPQWRKLLWRLHWALISLVVVVAFPNYFYFQVFVVGLGVGTIFALPLNERVTQMITGGRFAAYRAVLLWFQTR